MTEEQDSFRIKRSELIRIIKEEIDIVISEINPYHKGKGKLGGRFSTKEDGAIYSVPLDNTTELPKGRGLNNNGKPRAKFGMNSGKPELQCGRLTIDGDEKTKTKRCHDYPEHYQENIDLSEEQEKVSLARKCQEIGFRTFSEFLEAVNALEKAGEGKLHEPKTGK